MIFFFRLSEGIVKREKEKYKRFFFSFFCCVTEQVDETVAKIFAKETKKNDKVIAERVI